MLDGVGSISTAKTTNTDSTTTSGATEKPKINPDIAESKAMLEAGQATLICVLSQPNVGACISAAGLGAPPSFGVPAQPATAESGDGTKSGGMNIKVGGDGDDKRTDAAKQRLAEKINEEVDGYDNMRGKDIPDDVLARYEAGKINVTEAAGEYQKSIKES